MPMIDKPLEELKTYMGSSPLPEDFDRFWDDALAEMKAVDPQVELVPAKLQMEYFDLFHMYFTGVNGARIHAKLIRPKNITKPIPAVLAFHGYSGRGGDFSHYMHYAAQGYCVAALDCRGQAGESEDVGGVVGNTLNGHIIRGLKGYDPSNLLFRDIFLDCAQLAQIMLSFPEVDENEVYATGGSQGGALTLACAALEPRIRKAAPAYPFLSDYRRVWDMDMDERAYAEMRQFLRNFDPNHEHIDEFFHTLGYIDIQNLAKRIRADICFATGLMDNVCPPSTQFAVYNKICSNKKMVIYPDFGHEGLPGWEDKIIEFFAKK